jgi:hypothetical protein
VFPTPVAEEHIKLFTSSVEAKLTLVKGGSHYLNVTSPNEVEEAVLDMIKKNMASLGREGGCDLTRRK